ncbi:Zn-dependent hydrolase [Thermoplasma sp. Kam2015]|uniref:MBL fold metallo-hydrolase n=1 Tax=Thermoplasma sp. Kam2015 TaxID=2094122 RepID=UPI000D9F3FD2|nr:MBL fold metallo-hydrolase [Thermoplasma sp. Kam2015]PYB69071.1 Zn-dependent hydrolase [Thermoplasma sp. Kam2015]
MKIDGAVERIDGVMANVYLIIIEGKKVLIDAGTAGGGKKIIDFLDRNNTRPDFVLITHHHADHIGGLKEIADRFNPEIYVPDLEIKIITGEEDPPKPRSFLGRMVTSIMKFDPVKDVKPVSKADVPGVEEMATPGHTIGSTSYIVEDLHLLFSGDAAVESGGVLKINKSFTYEINSAQRSLEIIKGMKGYRVLPGHGDPVQL